MDRETSRQSVQKELPDNEFQQEEVKGGKYIFQKTRRQFGRGEDYVTSACEGCAT